MEDLTQAINEYIDKPNKEKKKALDEKTEFVEAVVDFFKTPGIDRLVRTGRRVDLIVLKSAYSARPDYELFYDSRGLVLDNGQETVYGRPSFDTWMDAIPYDSEFLYHGHFKPSKEEFVSQLENKVRCMIK